MRLLASGGLLKLEGFFSEFRNEIGEKNLEDLVHDLLLPNEPLLQTLRRPAALYGELLTYRELHALGARSIKKMTEDGDWLADGHTVSVKTILDLDSNYQLIESAFEGLAWRSEYPMIRRTKGLVLRNGEGLDDRFMRQILDFLHSDLEKLLVQLLTIAPHPRWYYAQIELMRDPATAETKEKRRFRVKASRWEEKQIHVELLGIGGSPPSTGKRQLTLRLTLRNDAARDLWMSNDYDAWSGSGQTSFGKLGDQIQNRLDALSKAHERGAAKSFLGWINITTHPSHQEEVATDPTQMQDLVTRLTSDLPYPTVVCLYGGFELAKPLLVCSASTRELFKAG